MKLSLQAKLMASFLVVITTCGVVATLVGVRLLGQGVVDQAQDKVRLDLNSARVIYEGDVGDVRDAVRHAAGRFFVLESLSAGDIDRLASGLDGIRQNESLDTLTLVDTVGKVLVRARNPAVSGDSQAANDVVKWALTERRAVASTEIVPREELLKEGEELASRAAIRLAPTPKAKPTDRGQETAGMMILAAAPVLDERGSTVGILYGGKLLNRHYLLVDKIRDTVYQGEVYRGKDIGTATVFQGDLRISTNVETADGRRAVGTRISEEVYNRVIAVGEPWIERAFVVNDWYVTAYEPIRNISGRVIGALYVGMLEQKFVDMKNRVLLIYLGITLGGIVVAIAICYLLTMGFTRPINALAAAAQRLAAGDLMQRVLPDESTKEIGLLGTTFNMMACSIQDRDEQLRQRAQAEIMKSERLALIGRLAAGVAHEINNPLGGILLLSSLLLRKSKAEGTERENLQRIANDAERCQKIVQGLLDFARQREPKIEPFNVNDVVNKAISLLENQAVFHDVDIVKGLQKGLPPVGVDEGQMVQVFVNIIMNAAESMKGKGTLKVSTSHRDDTGSVEVAFTDTGEGIPEENLRHLFEPFFTTKEVGHGTGLGLSISHGIVVRHGGTISVNSRVGEGAAFVISLPELRGEA